jgi:hypothetical protein
MAINFTPLKVVSMFRDSLRVWFRQYGGPDFAWDPDPKKNQIWIGNVNDYNSNEANQKMPRILCQRGAVQQNVQFINNSEEVVEGTQQQPIKKMRMDLNGSIQVIVEADNEGTCEALAEAVRRFVTRNRPMFEEEFGFQRFGWQIVVSECEGSTEDKEKFKIQVQMPYIVEDRWNYTPDAVLLKQIVGDVRVTK